MLRTNTVTLQISAKVAPAAVRQILMFSRTCCACAVTSPLPTVAPFSSFGSIPEMNSMRPARTTGV